MAPVAMVSPECCSSISPPAAQAPGHQAGTELWCSQVCRLVPDLFPVLRKLSRGSNARSLVSAVPGCWDVPKGAN